MNTEPLAPPKTDALPAYLVLDTSGSMKPHEELLNQTLVDIYDTLYSSPLTSEYIHLSVISFNTEPHVVTPITGIDELESLPVVACHGLTNLGLVLGLLRNRIAEDVATLSSANKSVLRPVVFLLTDGLPSDEEDNAWQEGVTQLHDKTWKPRPHVITYGFGSASTEVTRKVATLRAFVADGGIQSTGPALTAALTSVLGSMVNSARDPLRQLVVPEEVAGFKATAPLDVVG